MRGTLCLLLVISAVFAGPFKGEEMSERLAATSFSSLTKEGVSRGWSTSLDGPDAYITSQDGVVVPDVNSFSWHFIAPRKVVELNSLLYRRCISFSLHYSTPSLMGVRGGHGPHQQKSDISAKKPKGNISMGYDLLLSGVDSALQLAASAGCPALGVGDESTWQEEFANDNWYKTTMVVRIDESQTWINLATGEVAGQRQLEQTLASLDAVLVRPRVRPHDRSFPVTVSLRHFEIFETCPHAAARVPRTHEGREEDAVRNPAPPKDMKATLDDCDKLHQARRWELAQDCYSGALRLIMNKTKASEKHFEEQVKGFTAAWGGERICWGLLRTARLSLMLSKPSSREMLGVLATADAAAQHPSLVRQAHPERRDPAAPWAGLGASVGVGRCRAWVAKTRGDMLMRDKQYAQAAHEYREALATGIGDTAVAAVLHTDLAAAIHLAPPPGSTFDADVAPHYAQAVKVLPSLSAHHVLGTLGTFSYRDTPRIEIEKTLDRLSVLPAHATQPKEGWHAEVEAEVEAQALEWRRGKVAGRDAGCKQRISFFCRLRGQTPATADQVWGPSSVVRGLGGSEEAAVYLSRELTKLGYCVRIYGNPPPEELGVDQDGVVWLPFWAFSMWHAPDVAVLWRNMDSVWLAPRASRRYVWVHDPLALASDQHYFTDKFLRALAGIFVLSNHSRSQFPREAQGKLILSNNGLPPHLLRDGNNAHNKLLYASWPSSGLEQVLRQWPTIRAAAAAAELHVYGGFDWWWATPLYEKEAWFVEWRAVMEELLRQDGVIYWGGVGHQRMAEAYAETGFYVYPTETPETAPINLIKAQANGCIPITSRFAASAIAETTGAFDLGPPARAGSIKDDADWLDEWTAAVIKAIHTPQEELADHRRLMKQRARETYSWPKVAAAWDRAFHA